MRSKWFKRNLAYGSKAEKKAVEILRPQYQGVRRIADKYKGTFKEYDLIDDVGNTFEVKVDATSKKTGNIAIEHKSYGKLSGIASTKAKYWFQFFYCEGWAYTVCEVEDLRDLIILNNYRSVNGGEDMQSEMYLIPVIDFVEKFGYNII
jgi:Holliday junction resolvase-like predicted endonuclease